MWARQERGRLIFRTLAFRGGERNVGLAIKFDGEDGRGRQREKAAMGQILHGKNALAIASKPQTMVEFSGFPLFPYNISGIYGSKSKQGTAGSSPWFLGFQNGYSVLTGQIKGTPPSSVFVFVVVFLWGRGDTSHVSF